MNIKNLCGFISAVFCAAMLYTPANAGLATVGAVHDYVQKKWEIEIPYAPATAGNIPNMRYIMQLVDAANEELNEYPISNYANNTKYATSKIAADTAARDAVDTLIRKIEPYFFFTPATTSNTYSFQISAAGTFDIDWGDGKKQTIEKTNTNVQTISHTYASAANAYEIKLGGKATAYSTSETTAAISFTTAVARLKSIRGCLGCVFSTIDDERVAADMRQPRFYQTFNQNTALAGTIPAELFNGVHGEPVSKMFQYLFYNCGKLTGGIPANLFAGIQGAPTTMLFNVTFYGCSGLTGSIPENLFAGIKGPPAPHVFRTTFYNCSGLTGAIPEKLFEGIQGPPAEYMFYSVFHGCSNLSGSIPEKLFAGIKGNAAEYMFGYAFEGCRNLSGDIPKDLFAGINPTGEYMPVMFDQTFGSCSMLTGLSPKIGGKYLYEIWPAAAPQTYTGATCLSDYACIPKNWGGAGTKQPGECEPVVEEGGD